MESDNGNCFKISDITVEINWDRTNMTQYPVIYT